VALYASLLAAGARVQHALAPGRHAWVHIVRGALNLNNLPLATGDGAAVTDETLLTLTATDQAEVLLFDLP
jgi:redox-sensitive bicupin YhaK (pirin superfamily)